MIIDGIDLKAYEGYEVFPSSFVFNQAFVIDKNIYISHKGFEQYQEELRLKEVKKKFQADLENLLNET